MENIADGLLKVSDLHKGEELPKDVRYGFTKVNDGYFDDLRKMLREK